MRKLYSVCVSAAEMADSPMSAPPPSPQKAMTLIGSPLLFPLRLKALRAAARPPPAAFPPPGHEGARAGCFHHQLHHERRLAPLARPVAGGEAPLEGDLLDPLERVELLGR